ncbi:hypothetical protein FEM48_Zijuj01G0039000 [Ziziphus jujuba var. spinosa]|uniref:Uncharacterized protein n=1 Tax=Ziziphus jujuba var. spinosa TaxID=714518 RepID=A0A978VZ04_ZIZJJ|nr:hypothetical protein FEM48_Zijuj01G0039000 [Ziziphus jujuba var. spinosa]
MTVKREYVEELNDSLDLVPLDAWHENGRKASTVHFSWHVTTPVVRNFRAFAVSCLDSQIPFYAEFNVSYVDDTFFGEFF